MVFVGYSKPVQNSTFDGDLLTTGKAATLLGVCRQHVVDLCREGRLPFQTTGTHRRLRREDLERFARSGKTLRREEARSLWLNQAIAGKLVQDPEAILGRARGNLARFMQIHSEGMSAHWLRRWREVIEQGPWAVLSVLTSLSEESIELRQNSPFAGVLPADERQRVLTSFAEHWAQREVV